MRELAHRLLERSLSSGNTVHLEVQGTCMVPLLKDGDRVAVRPGSSFRPGDIVLARSAGGDLVCHRILTRTEDFVLLAGDRSPSPDLRPDTAVLGTVVERCRSGCIHRFDRARNRWVHRMAARLHLLSYRMRPHTAGRYLDGVRRRFLTLGAAIVASD